MNTSNSYAHAILLIIISACTLGSLPVQAFSLRDARELCKQHRFKILTITSAAVVYIYAHKLIEKAIHDYYHPEENTQKKQSQDNCEAYADVFIKSTKLIGTIFKVFRALTCPGEGKVTGDQWLDDFSQMA